MASQSDPSTSATTLAVNTSGLPATRAVYVGTAGDLVVTMKNGTSVTFKNVSAGCVLPIQITGVGSATTAADLIALY